MRQGAMKRVRSDSRLGRVLIAETEDRARDLGSVPQPEFGARFAKLWRDRFAKLGGSIDAVRAGIKA